MKPIKPLRALTPLQDKLLTLLVYASNRDGGAGPYVTTPECWAVAERLAPDGRRRAIERRCLLAMARLEAEGVAKPGPDLGGYSGATWALVRSLPAAARIVLLLDRTADRAANPPTRRKRNALCKQTEARQPGNERGRAAVDAQQEAPGARLAPAVDAAYRPDGQQLWGIAGYATERPDGKRLSDLSPKTAPQNNAQPVLARTDPQPDPEHVPNEPGANAAVSTSTRPVHA